jgi:hypothetical protein
MDMISISDSTIDARLVSLETGLDAYSKTTAGTPDMPGKQEIEDYIKLAQNSQAQLLRDYLQSSTELQQEQFKSILVQFSDYMQEQRREDLRMIQRNFVNLKENQDQQKKQTDEVLARILTTVNTQND